MAIPYTQPSMALVRAVDGTFISYPFIEDGDATTKVYNLACTQRASDYDAAQIDLDDNMSSAASAGVIALPSGWADSNAYFVGDTGHAPIAGGMISFTRTFANIPQSKTIASGSEFVTFPGILQGNLSVSALAMTFVSDPTNTMTITTGGAHGLGEGDFVQIRNLFFTKDGISDYIAYSREGNYTQYIATSVTSTSFTITDSSLGFDQQYDLAIESGEVRNPESFEYAISGVAVNPSGNGILLTTSADNTINAGQRLTCSLQFSIGTDPFVHSVAGQYSVISAPTNRTFVIDVGLLFDSTLALNLEANGRVISTGYSREQVSLNTPTSTMYQYILPGVTPGVDYPSSVVIPETFKVVSEETGDVEKKATNSERIEITIGIFREVRATIPSASAYIGMIGSGANIIIESSLSEWAGNILVLKTKTCKAR